MDVEAQIVIAFVISMVVCYSTLYFVKKKYRRESKSLKYLDLKIWLIIGLPINLLPFVLWEGIPIWTKIAIILVVVLIAVLNYFSVTSMGKTVRKQLGINIKDEFAGDDDES